MATKIFNPTTNRYVSKVSKKLLQTTKLVDGILVPRNLSGYAYSEKDKHYVKLTDKIKKQYSVEDNKLKNKGKYVYGLNKKLIKVGGSAFKKMLNLGYVYQDNMFKKPNREIVIKYDNDNLLPVINRIKDTDNIDTIIVERNIDGFSDKTLKHKFVSISIFRKWFSEIYMEYPIINIILVLSNPSLKFGPSFEGNQNCVIKAIESVYTSKKYKLPKNVSFENLYTEYSDGVFEEDMENISKTLKHKIVINQHDTVYKYGENFKAKSAINLSYNNNHMEIMKPDVKKKIEKPKKENIFIDITCICKSIIDDLKFGDNDTKTCLGTVHGLLPYLKTFDLSTITNIIKSNKILSFETNDKVYRLKYDNGIDLEKHNCYSSPSYVMKEFIKFSKKIKPVSTSKNIEAVKQILQTPINFNRGNLIDPVSIDLKNSYNNFGTLPTDITSYIDCNKMEYNEIIDIINDNEGFALIEYIDIYTNKLITNWRGFNFIRKCLMFNNIKITPFQLMISTDKVDININEFFKLIPDLMKINKRQFHFVLGKFQISTKNKSFTTTDDILSFKNGGNKVLESNGKSLYLCSNIKNHIGKSFYPHITAYVQEYTNIKVSNMYLELQNKNIKVSRIWVDNLYFEKKYLNQVKIDKKYWRIEDGKSDLLDVEPIKENPIKLKQFGLKFIKLINNLCYQGSGGTGKSQLLREIYNSTAKNLILVPTDLALKQFKDLNVITYQKFLTVSDTHNIYLRQYENIFIDEYTMISNEDFIKIKEIAINMKNMFLFGSITQLENFTGSKIDLNGFEIKILTKIWRQDSIEFQNLLNKTELTGSISYIKQQYTLDDFKNNPKLILSSTNKDIDRINHLGFENNTNENIDGFKVNSPIMFNLKIKALGIVNSEMGMIKNIKNGMLYITMNDGNNIEYSIEDANKIVKNKNKKAITLCYSISYHKIQGQTLTCDIVINKNRLFNKTRMLYVAVSRVKKLEQLYVLSFDDYLDDVYTDVEVDINED